MPRLSVWKLFKTERNGGKKKKEKRGGERGEVTGAKKCALTMTDVQSVVVSSH